MLAEIFMVRLEARARLANEAVPAGKSQFTPFTQGGRFAFKDGADRRADRLADLAKKQA